MLSSLILDQLHTYLNLQKSESNIFFKVFNIENVLNLTMYI